MKKVWNRLKSGTIRFWEKCFKVWNWLRSGTIGFLGKFIPDKKERKGINFAVLFLIIGLAVVFFAKKYLEIESDAVFLSLLIIPVVVYMVVSGKIEEFKAGGLAAKFTKVAGKSAVDKILDAFIEEEEAAILRKGGIPELKDTFNRFKSNLPKNKQIVMTLEPGYHYTREGVLQYIKLLSQFRNFKFVVFQRNGNYEAYMPFEAVERLVSTEDFGGDFIDQINEGKWQDLFGYPGLVREKLSAQSTNREALYKMEEKNLKALAVVDENESIKTFVELDQILSKIVLEVTK